MCHEIAYFTEWRKPIATGFLIAEYPRAGELPGGVPNDAPGTSDWATRCIVSNTELKSEADESVSNARARFVRQVYSRLRRTPCTISFPATLPVIKRMRSNPTRVHTSYSLTSKASTSTTRPSGRPAAPPEVKQASTEEPVVSGWADDGRDCHIFSGCCRAQHNPGTQ